MTFREALADLLEEYSKGGFEPADLREDLRDALREIEEEMEDEEE